MESKHSRTVVKTNAMSVIVVKTRTGSVRLASGLMDFVHWQKV
jgi:hypothetical protein